MERARKEGFLVLTLSVLLFLLAGQALAQEAEQSEAAESETAKVEQSQTTESEAAEVTESEELEAAESAGVQISYFAITSHRHTFDDGGSYEVGTITRVTDKSTCDDLARLKGQTSGFLRRVAADCFLGYEKDSGGVYYQVKFNEIFLNLPTAFLYVAFKDESGFPTRLHFGDAPLPDARRLASMVVSDLMKKGIEGIEIIEPDEI